jgi:hypothetical protein
VIISLCSRGFQLGTSGSGSGESNAAHNGLPGEVWHPEYDVSVDNSRVGASTKQRADADYGRTIEVFEKAGFTVNKEKSDKLGDSKEGVSRLLY